MEHMPTPTPRELEILKVLWELGPCTVRAVHRHRFQDQDVAYNTVQTMLRLMATKGLVSFEPVGRTDSERVLCWMLTEMHTRRVRSLAELGWDTLYSWFARLNGLGTANFILSDGRDLVVYQDRDGFNNLHWIRRRPRSWASGRRRSIELHWPDCYRRR